jgi:hypothetical protein
MSQFWGALQALTETKWDTVSQIAPPAFTSATHAGVSIQAVNPASAGIRDVFDLAATAPRSWPQLTQFAFFHGEDVIVSLGRLSLARCLLLAIDY